MARLALFDLDGTLIDTNEVDGECFVAAFREELGIDCSGADWSSFEHVTDSAIAGELLRRHGRVSEDAARVEQRFAAMLAASDRARFIPLPGAVELIAQLPAFGWHAAIATGAWGSSAAAKLRAAGDCFGDLPIATSDRCRTREEILAAATEAAVRAYGEEFERVVSIGDAPWDVAAARSLGLPFVGVGRGERRERLLRGGATRVLDDFADIAAVLAALEP